jgi:hypothetical protein
MKKVSMMAMLYVLVLVFCGAPQEGPAVEAVKPTKTDIWYAPLAEAELQKLIKTMPVFLAEVEKLDEEVHAYEDVMSGLRAHATLDKRLPGLDAKLRAAGMAWNEFWPAYSKTALAIAAVMTDSAVVAMQEQMKGQPPQMLEQAMSSMEEARTIYKDVPQANKDLVKKYVKDIVSVFEME